MTWDEAFRIATSMLVSIGGGAAIIGGMSSWLGKLWAERILNTERREHEKQLEILKSNLSSDVERLKRDLSSDVERLKKKLDLELEISKRFSEKQFYLYSDLWSALCDLRSSGQRLWEHANRSNLKSFSKQLENAEDKVMRSSLLIDRVHLRKLRELIEKFNKFEFGKKQLVQLRSQGNNFEQINEDEIRFVVHDNREVKEEYSYLLDEIENYFRDRIQGIE